MSLCGALSVFKITNLDSLLVSENIRHLLDFKGVKNFTALPC